MLKIKQFNKFNELESFLVEFIACCERKEDFNEFAKSLMQSSSIEDFQNYVVDFVKKDYEHLKFYLNHYEKIIDLVAKEEEEIKC